MRILNTRVCFAILAMIGTSVVGTQSYAESFTSSQVLEWEKDAQDNYFLASITMAGVVAAQNPGDKSRCVNNWYLSNDMTMRERNEYIRETLERFPTHHPAGVMMAILEKACGSFDFSESS